MTHELILTISKDLDTALNRVMRTHEYDGVIPAGRWAALFGFDPLYQNTPGGLGSIYSYMVRINSLTMDDCTRPPEWFQCMHQKGEFVWDEIHRILAASSPEKRERYNRNGYFDLPGIRSKCIKGLLSEQDHPFVKQPCILYPETDKDLYQKSWFFGVEPIFLDSRGKLVSIFSTQGSTRMVQAKAFYDMLWDRILNVRKGMHIFILDGHY